MRRLTTVLALLLVLALPAIAQDNGDAGKGLELMRAGKYSAALPYLRRDLDNAETRYGAKDPSIAAEINNLAEANRRLGHLDEAEALYKRAIALDERAKPQNPAGLATSLNNLALVYRAQGKLDEAAKLHNRSLTLLEQALGPNDPDVARSLNNLATLYRLQGKAESARPLQERAVKIADATLGPQHPDTQQLRRNLAALDGTPAVRSATIADPKTPRPAPAPPSKSASPRPEASPASTPPAAKSGGFALQLAAVPEASQVAAEWKRLSGRFALLEGLELLPPQAVEVAGKGTFYRLLAGPLQSRSEAEAACAQLRKMGGTCRVARP
jgi:tetratricopeptide (TPR) repeat protein